MTSTQFLQIFLNFYGNKHDLCQCILKTETGSGPGCGAFLAVKPEQSVGAWIHRWFVGRDALGKGFLAEHVYESLLLLKSYWEKTRTPMKISQ